jgi:hypothetical protein
VGSIEGKEVPPHPHIGLSTGSYLFSGNLTHKDSRGVEQVIKPGDGHGILNHILFHYMMLVGDFIWTVLPSLCQRD